MKTLKMAVALPFSKFSKFRLWAKGRRPGSLREGCCPSDAVGAGSPPQGAGGETWKTLKTAGAPSLAKFSKFCPRLRGRGRQFENLENGGHRPDRRFFQNPAPGPLGVATGPPMQTQSSLEGALCPMNRVSRRIGFQPRPPRKRAGNNSTSEKARTPPTSPQAALFLLWKKPKF